MVPVGRLMFVAGAFFMFSGEAAAQARPCDVVCTCSSLCSKWCNITPDGWSTCGEYGVCQGMCGVSSRQGEREQAERAACEPENGSERSWSRGLNVAGVRAVQTVAAQEGASDACVSVTGIGQPTAEFGRSAPPVRPVPRIKASK